MPQLTEETKSASIHNDLTKKELPTLKAIHAELSKIPATKRDEVLNSLNISPENSRGSFYDIINGRRKLNAAEKEKVAAIYEKKVDEINWQDEPKLVG